MFILPLIPGGHPSPCIMNNSRKWWSIQGLAPCLLPRPRRPWRSYLWKTIGWIEDDGTCRRYEDNRVPLPSVASNGWDGSGPLALPCSHTRVSSGCAYIGHGVQEICASTLLPLCFYSASTVHSFAWAEWLGQRRKGAGTERRPLVERKESGKSAIEIVPACPDDT